MKRVYLVLPVLAILGFVAGCAQPPTAEVDAAKSAVEAARKAEAEKYAASEFSSLETSIQEIDSELKTQQGKFPLFRNYDQAKQKSQETTAKAESVKTLAQENKAKAKAAAEAALNDANAAVAAASQALANAPKGKDTRADIEQLKSDLAGAQAQVEGVQSAIAREDFSASTERASAIKSSADNVKAQVDAAIEKAMSKKKGRRK